MKAVDDQLVTVRKVTGFTKDQMAEIEAQAYKTAKAYGVAADAYLENVAAFSRAGYKERASELAELAVKTQLVGDTTAEVANQFLLSVDAAYQYKGNIQELQKVLDGANEIDNKYATSIEKVASGLGIVAPVAKQARVGIDELTAAIGTITAVTQRSGSEAARAFRALALNIIGDTTTEVEDGATWTVGEIAGLRDVLKTYAPEAVKAAEATGKVINPMEAIGGLAKSMKEGLLTEQQLMSMVSDIGGKLRTSQLLALIQNWDMYQSMLKDYRGAVGSADKEVENALDSWTRKSEILKNTWVEFLNNVISTDTIKGALDFFTKVINGLNTDLGRTVLALGAVNGAIILIGKSIAQAMSANKNAGILSLAKEFPVLAATVGKFMLAAGAVAGIVYGLKKLVDYDKAHKETFEKAKKRVEELNTEYEKMFGAGTEYDTLISQTKKLTQADKERLAVLEGQRKAMEDQIAIAKKEEFEQFRQREQAGDSRSMEMVSYGNHRGERARYTKSYEQVELDLLKEGQAAAKTAEQYGALVAANKERYELLIQMRDAGFELSDVETEFVRLYGQLAKRYSEMAEGATTYLGTLETQNVETQTLLGVVTKIAPQYEALVKAQQESDENGRLSVATLTTLNEKYPELIQYLTLTENGYILTKSAVDQYIQSTQIVESGASGLIDASRLKAAGFDVERMSVRALLEAMLELYKTEAMISGAKNNIIIGPHGDFGAQVRGANGTNRGNLNDAVNSKIQAVQSALDNLDVIDKAFDQFDFAGGGGSGRGGGGSSAKAQTDAVLDGHKKTVALLKSELDLMEKQGASGKDRIDKLKDIQSALHDEAEYLRSIGAEQTEINALSSEWWDIEKQIRDIQKEIVDELKAAVDAQLEQAAAVRDAKISALDKQLDALKEARDVEKDRLTLEEKQLAVEEARAALEEARNERNVRYYNSKTGQWEWGANQQNVKSAQEALTAAEKELADYQEELAYNEAVKAIEAKKEAINASYETLKSGWEAIINSLKAPTANMNNILTKISNITLPQLQTNLDAFSALLSGISGNASMGGKYSDLIPMGSYNGWQGMTTQEIKDFGDWSNVRGMTDEEKEYYARTGKLPDDYYYVHYAGQNMGSGDGYNQGDGYDRYWMDDEMYGEVQQAKADYEAAKLRGDKAGMEEAHNRAEHFRNRMGYSGGVAGDEYERVIVYAPKDSELYKNSLVGLLNEYDSGGILRGLGGIKATTRDEIVVPPEVTQYLLNPAADSVFNTRMEELKFFYGGKSARDTSVSKIGNTVTKNDHSGTEYHFGNITLSESRAKETSVFDLARMSRNLGIYNHA